MDDRRKLAIGVALGFNPRRGYSSLAPCKTFYCRALMGSFLPRSQSPDTVFSTTAIRKSRSRASWIDVRGQFGSWNYSQGPMTNKVFSLWE